MKYQGYTILRNIDGYVIYDYSDRNVGCAGSVNEAKTVIDNIIIANFA
jgi:hypothetical protein